MLGVMTVRRRNSSSANLTDIAGFTADCAAPSAGAAAKPAGMALSFEMTFLSMLLTSLYEPQTNGEMRRCAFHPIEKRLMLGNDAIDYCADLSALISYYDLRDGWEDERRVDRLAESALLRAAAGRAGNALPRQKEAVERYVARLHEVERRNDMNLDAAANLSGEMLGELYVWKKDVYEAGFARTGLYLGKFIYLCDSFEDVEQDIKRRITIPSSSGLKGRNLRLRAA